MEAYVWACTDSHLGVAISTRVFGSVDDAKVDAQEAIGDACPVEWEKRTEDDPYGDAHGSFTDTEGREGHVAISLVKVNL